MAPSRAVAEKLSAPQNFHRLLITGLILGVVGLCMRPRFWGVLLAYVVLRSALLLTVEAPESRYTIECFPMLIAGGGIALAWAAERIYLLKLKAPLGNG